MEERLDVMTDYQMKTLLLGHGFVCGVRVRHCGGELGGKQTVRYLVAGYVLHYGVTF